MGAEQSKQLKRIKQNSKLQQTRAPSVSSSEQSSSSRQADNLFDGKIVVVSKGDSEKDENVEEKEFLNFLHNHQFNPLLPKHQGTIPDNYQQIDSISMNNLCKHMQSYLKEKSEIAARDQNAIYERIKKIDYVTAFIANLIAEKEKSQNRTIDILNRMNDLTTLTQTYQQDIEKCENNLTLLNSLLEPKYRIEDNL